MNAAFILGFTESFMEKTKIITVVGPTASGKSEYALTLAEKLGGEIISGDSMQIYRGMDIGTAKPTSDEMRGIRHHLIDIAGIEEPFSVSKFVILAEKAIEDVSSRGKTPIIAGGTGLYIDTLVSGISLSETEEDEELREKLYKEASEHGAEALHEKLKAIDEKSAESIHPNNIKRVVRALEIYYTTGMTKSELDEKSKHESRYDAKTILLVPKERETLYNRIDARVDKMFERGLEEEVKGLAQKGLRDCPTASQAIGYKEFYPYFDGVCGIDAVNEAIKLNTRHYAKRQLTWFLRRNYEDVEIKEF